MTKTDACLRYETISVNCATLREESFKSFSFTLPFQAIMPGLNLVATPIGNLADISLRAVMALASADKVICEDTRHTAKLFKALGLKKDTMTYHDHSDEQQRKKIISLLRFGKSLALVCDAGMPLISDPGYKLVRDVVEAGIPVQCYPGPNAAITALICSGLPTQEFLFVGFLPVKEKACYDRLEVLRQNTATLIFYERAQRLGKFASQARLVLGDRQCCLGRELTKKFETFWRGSLEELEMYVRRIPMKGECVLVLEGGKDHLSFQMDTQGTWQETLDRLVLTQPLKDAARDVAKRYGLSRRDVYQWGLKQHKREKKFTT